MSKNEIRGDFVTNEWKDFLDNLDHLSRSVRAYHGEDTSEFKWIVITLFMTLQSIFVVCLKNTDFHNVTRNETRGKRHGYRFALRFNWDAGKVVVSHDDHLIELSTHFAKDRRLDQLTAINRELSNPLTEADLAKILSECWMLVDFSELYQRVKSNRMCCYISSKPLPSEARYDTAIQDLIDLRNQFIHFVPKSWSITSGHIKTVIVPCLEILRFLLVESGNVHPDDPTEAMQTTDELIALLN